MDRCKHVLVFIFYGDLLNITIFSPKIYASIYSKKHLAFSMNVNDFSYNKLFFKVGSY